jgi:AcrR family transcriptional regulator
MESKANPASFPRGEARRQELLDGLEEIFLKEGVRRVRVQDLAARLRCSRRTLYSIARTKEELFARVVERWLGRIQALGREAFLLPDPETRLREYLRAAVRESRPATAAFVEDMASQDATRSLLSEHQRVRAAGLREILEQGVETGAFRPVHSEFLAELILQALGSLRDPGFIRGFGLSLSDAFERFGQLVQHGLCRRES